MGFPSTIPWTEPYPLGHGRGICQGCKRDLFIHGDAMGQTHCLSCVKSMERYPDIPLADQKNGRTEVMLVERGSADTSWWTNSTCRDAPAELFAPTETDNASPPREAYATVNDYCAVCPVLDQCAADADAAECEGIFGGAWRRRSTTHPFAYRAVPLIGVDPPVRDRRGRHARARARASERAA